MNKFILGGILAAISLMAIYGTSASNQVASWVDQTDDDPSSQTNFEAADDATSGTVVALNGDDANGNSIGIISSRTPLEKAGEIPQRQVVGVQSAPAFGINAQTNNAGDDTDGVVVEPNPTAGETAQTTPQTPPANQGQAQPQPTNQNQNQPPVRALW
ncbi:hypothetical protein [Adonisia turfae]